MRVKDPIGTHAITSRRERGHGGNLRHRTVEVVIQIFLSDSQGANLVRFTSRPASITIAAAVRCRP